MHTDTRTLQEKIADRDAKLDALQEQLTEAVEGLVTSQDWQRALTIATQFRSRSFNNSLLIWKQHAAAHDQGLVPDPSPTYVAGFRQWHKLGRHVMKGQPGYQILSPVTARMATTDPENGPWRRLTRGEKPGPGEIVRSRMIGVRPAYVWDISQTDGAPLPEQPGIQLPIGQAPAGLWDGLAAQIASLGYDLQMVPDAAALGGASGRTTYGTHLVQVRADLDDAGKVAVVAHELAHAMLHAPGHDTAPDDGTTNPPSEEGRSPHQGIREVEADSVAFMVNAAHGLDTKGSTIPYVADWASSVPGSSPIETIQSTAARVRATAITILDRLETPQVPNGTPPELALTPKQPSAAPTAPVGARPTAGITL